ncbi:hypothetical protein AX17_002966 [Amanita inopinata Kibby_2008]|nr:hypothetical protein AX17_002966 [Amanita inopinata Kibby_2008]
MLRAMCIAGFVPRALDFPYFRALIKGKPSFWSPHVKNGMRTERTRNMNLMKKFSDVSDVEFVTVANPFGAGIVLAGKTLLPYKMLLFVFTELEAWLK